MTRLAPYATRLRVHLAASRERGLVFADAWQLAQREVVLGPGDGPWPEEARDWFRQGYEQVPVGVHEAGGVPMRFVSGALAERDEFGFAPESGLRDYRGEAVRTCGSGDGCARPATGLSGLCDEHSEAIRAAFERSEYRGRGEHIAEASERARTAA